MFKRSTEAVRADILVALRDYGPLITNDLERKANVDFSNYCCWLLEEKLISRTLKGRSISYEITTKGLVLIEQLNKSLVSRRDMRSFVKKHYASMRDVDIARHLLVSARTVQRLRESMGLVKGPGGVVYE